MVAAGMADAERGNKRYVSEHTPQDAQTTHKFKSKPTWLLIEVNVNGRHGLAA
jgi:hypothetical protein